MVVFVAMRLVPGDPAEVLAGDYASDQYIAELRASLGLNEPIYVQYVIYLNNLAHGDFGRSIKSRRPVLEDIAQRVPATMQLALAAMALASLLGFTTGIISAVRPYTWLDYGGMALSLIGISMPVFWLGLLMMLLFSVRLGWLPAGGRSEPLSIVLPAVALALGATGQIARMVRAAMLEILQSDYIRTARAKGLPGRVVTIRHGLRNAMLPVVTILGLQFGHLLGGAIVTETVFAWPGLGRLIVDAVASRDYAVIQGTVIVFVLSFAVVNLAVDISYAALDPRIRYRS